MVESAYLFYFAGRPVAQLTRPQAGGGADTLLYLTTDHLGTPIQATDTAGAIIWEGGLDPFGTPFVFPRGEVPPEGGDRDAVVAGLSKSVSATMESAGIFLRFPGQWDDPSFRSHGLREGLYYNVHRYYMPGAGRYTQPDPLGLFRSLTHYVYATSSPLNFVDPDGRIAKPPDAKNCGASIWNPEITLPKPNCRACDPGKVKTASTNVQSNKQGFCGGGKKCASEEELRRGARGGVDENTGQAWYRPQGDPCVDYCICVHEQDHIRRLFYNPYRDASCEELECLASIAQLRCLKGAAAGRL